MLLHIMLILALQGRGSAPPPRTGPPLLGTSESDDLLSMQPGAIQQSLKDGIPVYGKLIFPPGLKDPMVDVVLESFDGVIVAKTNSGPNTEFRFNNVRLGRYNIVIEGERYENVRHMLEVDARAFGMINVEIRLRPRAGFESTNVQPVLKANIPRDAQKEFEKGLEQQRKGDARKAAGHYEKALKIAPTFYEANVQLGIYHQKTGNGVEAARLLEQAVKSNPSSLSGRITLSRLYIQTEQFLKILDTLRDAPRGMGSADVYYLMGIAHYKLDNLAEAEKELQHSIEIAPDAMGGAHLQLYNVYMKTRQPLKALEALDTYIKKSPNAPDRAAIEDRAEKLRKALNP